MYIYYITLHYIHIFFSLSLSIFLSLSLSLSLSVERERILPKFGTRNPILQTRNLSTTRTQNTTQDSRNPCPKPETRNPKLPPLPETCNQTRKPETKPRTPQPETRISMTVVCRVWGVGCRA